MNTKKRGIRLVLAILVVTAVSVAALTIYDMCKAVQRDITITDIRLLCKSGGKSGTFIREEEKDG